MSVGASGEEIKKAYRSLSRKYHPDKNPNKPEAVEQFQKLTFINSVLSDPSKRAHYDRFGLEDLDEVDDGGEDGAEVGSDEEGEELDAESFRDLLNKFRERGGAANPSRSSSFFDLLEVNTDRVGQISPTLKSSSNSSSTLFLILPRGLLRLSDWNGLRLKKRVSRRSTGIVCISAVFLMTCLKMMRSHVVSSACA